MLVREYGIKKVYMGRMDHGSDLLKSLEEFVIEKGIKTGIIQLVGAATKVGMAYYDEEDKVYYPISLNKPVEIAKSIGNISIKDGKPMVHLHITVSDEEGNAFAGHLTEGTTVFAGEFSIIELEGPELVREYDDITGLTLWK